ncbi:hypothetical protein HPC37_00490 [Pasteurellaceae bacterium 20609_3]|uniref:hypothetical protein n=1 Tax=Spirabiliibacterium mucosae TaxID=28156 RepID=UPI001AAD1729|nr:hypothetical protein [Spirabiliibacterium mucosae]MBE2897362.1 hypothetical protein [Spirabiliibacterium mucosae]
MERLIRHALTPLLALCLTGCIATGERKLAFVGVQGQPQVVAFSGEKPAISAHIQGQTLALQQLGGHQILLAINHHDAMQSAVKPRDVNSLTLYEIAPAGFIEVFELSQPRLCQAYLAHRSVAVAHALSFGIRELNAVGQRPHFWGQWPLKDDKLGSLSHAKLTREQLSQEETARLVAGSARKLASFLTYICQTGTSEQPWN